MAMGTKEFGQFVRMMHSEAGLRRGRGEADLPSSRSGVLASIEAGKQVDFSEQALAQLDADMCWPSNLSTLLLESDSYHVSAHIRRLSFGSVADLQRDNGDRAPIIGVLPADGRPVTMPTQLTTTLHRNLVLNIAHAWRSTTFIDMCAYDHPDHKFHLKEFFAQWGSYTGGQAYTTISTNFPGTALVIDPVPEIDSMRRAETLIDLLSTTELTHEQKTRKAFTLVWAAAQANRTKEAGLTVLTRLAVDGRDPSTRSIVLDKFLPTWRESGLSAAAAEPDWDAIDLFAGIMQASDTLTDVRFTPNGAQEPEVITIGGPTISPIPELFRDVRRMPSLVLYDSRINPEVPSIANWFGSVSLPTLTIAADNHHVHPDPAGAGTGYVLRLAEARQASNGGGLSSYGGIDPYGTQPRLDGWFGDRTLVLMDDEVAQRVYVPQGLY
ncbi:hypothetical protein [Mycolicibacterium porcinum]